MLKNISKNINKFRSYITNFTLNYIVENRKARLNVINKYKYYINLINDTQLNASREKLKVHCPLSKPPPIIKINKKLNKIETQDITIDYNRSNFGEKDACLKVFNSNSTEGLSFFNIHYPKSKLNGFSLTELTLKDHKKYIIEILTTTINKLSTQSDYKYIRSNDYYIDSTHNHIGENFTEAYSINIVPRFSFHQSKYNKCYKISTSYEIAISEGKLNIFPNEYSFRFINDKRYEKLKNLIYEFNDRHIYEFTKIHDAVPIIFCNLNAMFEFENPIISTYYATHTIDKIDELPYITIYNKLLDTFNKTDIRGYYVSCLLIEILEFYINNKLIGGYSIDKLDDNRKLLHIDKINKNIYVLHYDNNKYIDCINLSDNNIRPKIDIKFCNECEASLTWILFKYEHKHNFIFKINQYNFEINVDNKYDFIIPKDKFDEKFKEFENILDEL